MCQVNEHGMRRTISIILRVDASSLFYSQNPKCILYQQAKELLQGWYNSEEKPSRILEQWKTMKLTAAMIASKNECDVAVFRRFVARLMRRQKSYTHDIMVTSNFVTGYSTP